MPASGFNAIAQLQSELRSDWQTRNPSTTITQAQSTDTASDADDSESDQGAVATVTLNIGNNGSTLQIEGGGMRLP